MAQAHLDPLFGRREYGVAGYFGTGARAVVGMATSGAAGLAKGRPRPVISR